MAVSGGAANLLDGARIVSEINLGADEQEVRLRAMVRDFRNPLKGENTSMINDYETDGTGSPVKKEIAKINIQRATRGDPNLFLDVLEGGRGDGGEADKEDIRLGI